MGPRSRESEVAEVGLERRSVQSLPGGNVGWLLGALLPEAWLMHITGI